MDPTLLRTPPSWKKRKQAPLEAVRAAAYDLSDIEGWFEKLHAVIQEHGITPENIWNMDDTGFRIGTSKSQYVLTEHPEKSHFLPIANNRESLTVVEAVSAGGIAIPAMLVIAAKQHQLSWFQNLHDTTLVGVADNGYLNDELMVTWIAPLRSIPSALKEVPSGYFYSTATAPTTPTSSLSTAMNIRSSPSDCHRIQHTSYNP